MFFGVGVVANVFWFFITRDWQLVLVLFYLIPLIVTFRIFAVFMADTPICLVMRNDASYALREFRFIAEINSKSFDITEHELKQIN